ncbi:MAG: S-layer homology domain-containing protein [Oscillospiraceae bacterium]
MREKGRKQNIAWLGLLMLLVLCGCGAAQTTADVSSSPEPQVLTVSTPPPTAVLTLAAQDGHPALMKNRGSGQFDPAQTVTRSALCRMLAPMLEGLTASSPAFADYQAGDSGYREAASLFAAGLLPETEDGCFGPDEAVSRQELSYILCRLAEALPDEDGARARVLAADVTAGVTARSGKSAGNDELILREELAVVLVRLAGRTLDETGLFLAECLPADISREDYAWAYIADAVTDGAVPAAEPGVHRAYNWLYAVWEDGTLVCNADYDVWSFAPDGGYTTGSAELDGYLRGALEEIGADALDDEAALQAAYLYVKYFGEYLVQPEDMTPLEPGAMGWEYNRALRFFHNGGGTCYGFAAAFGMLARVLGQEAYIVSAEVNQYHGAHAFVVIPEDGIDWIYDVELEATRQERHPDLALYRMQNYTTYFYWYEPVW